MLTCATFRGSNHLTTARLVLEDGTEFVGRAFGAPVERAGEVCFHTGMTGYQEILTDPSYRGQIVVLTYPHIGNYGTAVDEVESRAVQVEGFVVRECARRVSHWKPRSDLAGYLSGAGVPGIEGIDTRALTRKLRSGGLVGGILTTSDAPVADLARKAAEMGRMTGRDLATEATCPEPWDYTTAGTVRIAVYDFGVKTNILRSLASRGCQVRVFPATTPPAQVREWKPDGVLLSNGPGDPAAVGCGIEAARVFSHELPTFGICLGHQMLGLAWGAKTYKLKFGHHAANHPVRDHETGKIEITSQNHGFAVDPDTLSEREVRVTHTNLNDGTIEGIAHRELRAFAIQYHPEAAPGPHDSRYLFDRFVALASGKKA